MDQIERVARITATKGRAEVAKLRAIIERAQAMLDEPAFVASTVPNQAWRRAAYDWDTPELFAVGQDRHLYRASVADFATGQGLTQIFHAGYARSEHEFRRIMARDLPGWLVNGAVVERSGKERIAGEDLFLSPALRQLLTPSDSEEEGFAALSFHARLHTNSS
ncbi:hypothetical protein [Sphingomonas oligoaromativorans]|uniref:hypothetical protein n=1 Tax=Sphingomonas oligoaromativorans TaxID=575322 RepID=UPI00142289CE|nr:hypothetical protein [Sphingomonas oligoaromativorans]NIJ35302.1 hypothetical protein [Sphingomonas oligoaromativorans]